MARRSGDASERGSRPLCSCCQSHTDNKAQRSLWSTALSCQGRETRRFVFRQEIDSARAGRYYRTLKPSSPPPPPPLVAGGALGGAAACRSVIRGCGVRSAVVTLHTDAAPVLSMLSASSVSIAVGMPACIVIVRQHLFEEDLGSHSAQRDRCPIVDVAVRSNCGTP